MANLYSRYMFYFLRSGQCFPKWVSNSPFPSAVKFLSLHVFSELGWCGQRSGCAVASCGFILNSLKNDVEQLFIYLFASSRKN